jgi:hypothetical protein
MKHPGLSKGWPGILFGLAIFTATVALLSGCADSGSNAGDTGSGAAEAPLDTSSWDTDFSSSAIDLDEISSGGPGKDGIPAIDEPRFQTVEQADRSLSPDEQFAVLESGGETKAYPIQILTWHEIVNDEIDGKPVAMTFCPLCNSTVAYDRTVDGQVLDFGTTGNLRKSDLVMYDRQTET